jgi:hypothetical protein
MLSTMCRCGHSRQMHTGITSSYGCGVPGCPCGGFNSTSDSSSIGSQRRASIKTSSVIPNGPYIDPFSSFRQKSLDQLREHIEMYAAAFLKATNLSPDKVVMMSTMGFDEHGDYVQKIWFEERKDGIY